jgi:ankyrin repeat protein
LFAALRKGDAALCELLLGCGADPNQPGPEGAAPLAFVMARKDTAILDALLTHSGPRKLPLAAISAAFPAAARTRWPEALDALAHAGADPDAPDAGGHTAAMIAFAANDRATLRQILRLGADPARRDRGGRLLLERAAAEGRVPLVKLLAGYGAPAGDALYAACARGDGVMARLLIACGVADSRPAPASDSPEAAAVRAGDDELAAMLTTAAGGFNHRLPEGQTLLHLAVVKRCHRTVKALLDTGADPNLFVNTPVSDAFIRHVRPGSMRSFLRRDRNLTPLMLAADAGSPETVRHLLAAGAKRSTRSGVNRFWPVNFAAIRGDPPVIRAMLGRDPYREARHFVIQLSTQRMTGYDADRNVIFSSSVSTGRKGKETRTGEFVITDKYRSWTSTIYRVSMPYFHRLNCSDFGIHQGYVPGHPASAGCIRVPAGKAVELFKLTETGDRVAIVP